MESTRRSFNRDFLLTLAEDFKVHGRKVLDRVRRESPASYLKVCAMLVPKELKVEHTASAIKDLTDEQLDAAIAAVKAMLDARAGEDAKVIEGVAEAVALPAPDGVAPNDKPERPNKVMDAVDTAVGPMERKPRKRKVPSPPSA